MTKSKSNENPIKIGASDDSGYVLIVVLILMALGIAVGAAALGTASASARTVYSTKIRSERFYKAEGGMHHVVSWLRTYSGDMTSPFSKSNFANKFDRTAPSYGSNDSGTTKIPTKIKLKGTNDSAILTNDTSMVTAAYPSSNNMTTNAAFAATSIFPTGDFGNAKVRVTLVDALPLDPTQDSPPLASANTDYYPVYRVDSLTDDQSGAHVWGYVVGSLYYIDIIGFYGRDFVSVEQDCTSSVFSGGAPGMTNAKCPVGSKGPITVKNNAEVYGSARSDVSVGGAGKVCADYPSCANPGTQCTGTSCNVPDLPTFSTWSTYCPTNNGDYVVAANQNKTLVTAGCYNTVTINNKGSLTLTTTNQPYYFKTLTVVGGNPLTQLRTSPSPATGVVQLYVETITGDNINGNQTINPSSRPSQFKLYYLGTNALTLNGNANIGMALVAPYASVTVLGSNTFYGGIVAKDLTLRGSATVMYDESLGGSTLSDVTYRLRHEVESYR